MVTHNKLVRDRIPEIIKASGKSCEVKTLNDQEYIENLNIKLKEELKEYMESGDIEELADLVEVVYAIVKQKGINIEEFEKIRLEKKEQRGGFDDRLFLISVSDK